MEKRFFPYERKKREERKMNKEQEDNLWDNILSKKGFYAIILDVELINYRGEKKCLV